MTGTCDNNTGILLSNHPRSGERKVSTSGAGRETGMLMAQTSGGKPPMCKVPAQVQGVSTALQATAGGERGKEGGKPCQEDPVSLSSLQ